MNHTCMYAKAKPYAPITCDAIHLGFVMCVAKESDETSKRAIHICERAIHICAVPVMHLEFVKCVAKESDETSKRAIHICVCKQKSHAHMCSTCDAPRVRAECRRLRVMYECMTYRCMSVSHIVVYLCLEFAQSVVVCESWHIRASHGTYERVIAHINES